MNYRDEIEIDLIDLLHHLLLKWRQMLVCMLVGMILVGIYGYNKKVPVVIDDNTGEVVEAPVVDEKSLAYLGSKLNDYEKNEAVLAVETYLDYEKAYADRKKLSDESILLQLDPFKVPACVTTYKIIDFTNENVPDESTLTNVDNIVVLYKNALFDKSVISEIKSVNNWDYEDGFVREIISIGKTGLDIMTVTCNGLTKEQCESIMDVLDKKINTLAPVVKSQYEHDIKKIQRYYYEIYNSSILDQQKTQKDTLIGIEKSMQTVASAMTADQKAYYAALLSEVKAEMTEGDKDADALAIAKQGTIEEEQLPDVTEAVSQSQAAVAADKATENEQNVVMVPSKSISVRYIALGAFAGILLVLCFYGALYVLSPKLRTKRDIQDVFGLAVLGEIREENRYNKPLSCVDRFIDSLFEKKDEKLSESERMEIISSAICLGIAKAQVKSIFFTGVGTSNRTADFKGKLIAEVEKSSANDNSFTTLSGPSPLLGSDTLKELSTSDAVVLVEEVASSRYEDIARILEICNRFGVKVLGTVVLS